MTVHHFKNLLFSSKLTVLLYKVYVLLETPYLVCCISACEQSRNDVARLVANFLFDVTDSKMVLM